MKKYKKTKKKEIVDEIKSGGKDKKKLSQLFTDLSILGDSKDDGISSLKNLADLSK